MERDGSATTAERQWNQGVQARAAVGVVRADAEGGDRFRGMADVLQRRAGPESEAADPVVAAVAAWAGPDGSVLDIGAGTGRTTIPLAQRVGRVTALEPSAAMRRYLDENVARTELTNVAVESGNWPEVALQLGRFDVVLASHVVYFVSRIRAFIEAAERAATHRVAITVRLDSIRSGPLADIGRELAGEPGVAPTEGLFWDFYPVLLDLRIAAEVRIHPRGMGPRRFDSLAEAAALAARLMRRPADDPQLAAALASRLHPVGAYWEWRKAPLIREALVSWRPRASW